MTEFLSSLVAPKSSGKPASPVSAQLHFDTTTNTLYYYNGSEWVPASTGTAAAGQIYSVRAATTANITIATALNNGDSLDGVSLVTGDRVLVKNQSTASQNGIYVVGASPARASDADGAGEFQSGSLITVSEGTVNADSVWMLTTNGSITHGTTSLAFARKGGAFIERKVSSAALVLTEALQDVPGLSITVAEAGTYRVDVVLDAETLAASCIIVGELSVGGVLQPGVLIHQAVDVNDRDTVAQQWVLTGVAANTVIKMRARRGTAAAQVHKEHCTMIVQQIV